MKKFLLFIALALLSVISMQAKDERYTVFDENSGTLTYYYDDVREYRSGTKEVYSASATRFEGYNELITRVVIDFTMRNDPSKVFFSLFRGNSAVTLKNVTEIVGLEPEYGGCGGFRLYVLRLLFVDRDRSEQFSDGERVGYALYVRQLQFADQTGFARV